MTSRSSLIGPLVVLLVCHTANAVTTIQQISTPQSLVAITSDAFVGNGLVAWTSQGVLPLPPPTPLPTLQGEELNLYNIATGTTTTYPVSGLMTGFDGHNAVFTNGQEVGGGVYVYNLASQTEYQISSTATAIARISGNYVAYAPVFAATSYYPIDLYNISSQATTVLNNPTSSDNAQPSVNSNGQVSYEQYYSSSGTQLAYYNGSSYNYNLAANPSSAVESELPSMSNSIIAFDEFGTGVPGREMFVYSIPTGTIQQISQVASGIGNAFASASGETVAWQASGASDIDDDVMIFDGTSTRILSSYTPYDLDGGPALSTNAFPGIDGSDVVWVSGINGSANEAVYLAVLPEPRNGLLTPAATIALAFWRYRRGSKPFKGVGSALSRSSSDASES
jgi:hypothetical protein